jgi:hypothetical protein
MGGGLSNVERLYRDLPPLVRSTASTWVACRAS